MQLVPNHGMAWHNLGKALFELGQIDPALDAYREAAARLDDPEMPLGMIATAIPGSPRADPRAILEARRDMGYRQHSCPAPSKVVAAIRAL